jgi:putative ABC transport system permease protein
MILSTINQGILWGILGIGIFLTFRILNFPDMTIEGSFPLGGVIAVTAITHGIHPVLATLLAVLGGAGAGLVTGLLYTKGKIPTLLSGILVMTASNSVMLMIMGRANLGLLGQAKLQSIGASLIVGAIVLGLVFYFLNTNLGQAFVATGDNKSMASSFGINTDHMELMGLVISNGVIALAGAMISQNDGYADVSKGIGVIVIGLAAIIIGEVFYENVTMFERLIAIVVGAIIYQFLLLAVISSGLNPNYMKLFSAIVLAICLMVPTFKSKVVKGAKLNA